MNSSQPKDPPADESAALWAARLEGSSLDAIARAELDAWLAERPEHRGLLSQYCQFSADLEVQLPTLVQAGVIALPAPTISKPARWTAMHVAATTVIVAAALVLGLWMARPSGARLENFVAPPGQRAAFTLADGTRVELNAHSSLQFTNRNGGERRAKLLGGEALFMVSKDPAHPFVVETPAGLVRVTGTTFDVCTAETSFEVTVVEGTVQVIPGTKADSADATSLALTAGDQLSANASGVAVRKLSANALDDVLAWRQGIVVFVDEPLVTAVARFAQYHGRTVHVSPAAAKQRVGGRYRLDDFEGFLSGLEEPLGIRTASETSGALRVSLRSE